MVEIDLQVRAAQCTFDFRWIGDDADALESGIVGINTGLISTEVAPFGGVKMSGLGRELGREGLEAFQETKHVHMETESEQKDWWYPYGSG